MNVIFKTKFGSHLYGTSTPASDEDWKAVFIPDARSIILGRGKDSFNRNDKEDDRSGSQRKNEPGEIDVEFHSLKKFLSLASQGQTVALDMLFATPLITTRKIDGEICSPWAEIWKNRHRLASRQSKSFIGYAYQQASKYGVKGSRMAAAEKVSLFFQRQVGKRGTQTKAGEAFSDWRAEISGTEHCSYGADDHQNGGAIEYFECCGRKALFSASLKEAHAIFAKIFENYGHRARQARDNQNVDWKALSHAVRIGRQAVEFLGSGFITFPRPEGARLLQIKQGDLPYVEVAEEIEQLLDDVRAAAERSLLPEKPDHEWIDDFVFEIYKGNIVGNMDY